MRKLRLLVLLIAFVHLPAVARADGFIDWWEKWSGPKMFGVGADLHLFCVTNEGRSVPLCERVVVTKDLRAADLRHIVDGRVAYYWDYGKRGRFSDVADDRSVNALRLAGVYHYRVVRWLDLGAGAGYMRVTGDGFPEPLSRAVFTPVSLFLAPFKGGPLRVVTVRFESNFITKGFNGDQFGNKATYFDTYGGEWSNSVGFGIDFLRLR